MKLRTFSLIAGVAAVVFAQERVFPGDVAALNMLTGQWLLQGGRTWIEFRYDPKGAQMIGSTRPNVTGSKWRRMMLIYAEGRPEKLRADYYEPSGGVTHYHLVSANFGRIHFADDPVDGAPLRELTYEKRGSDQIGYRFEKDHQVVESGVMSLAANLQPLKRPEKLVQPLSD